MSGCHDVKKQVNVGNKAPVNNGHKECNGSLVVRPTLERRRLIGPLGRGSATDRVVVGGYTRDLEHAITGIDVD